MIYPTHYSLDETIHQTKISTILKTIFFIIRYLYLQLIHQMQKEQKFYDVIIVGAGISGLVAADILLTQEKSTLILEASSECGGLIYGSTLGQVVKKNPGEVNWIQSNPTIRDSIIELGASEISSDHTNMIRYANELDLTLFSSYADGMFMYGQSPENILYKQSLMDVYLTPQHKKHVLKLLSKIDSISKNIKQIHSNTVNNPSRGFYKNLLKEYIEIYDKMTVEEFINNQIPNEQLRKIVCNEFETVESISVSKMSVLQVFFHQYGLENLKLFIDQNLHHNYNLRLKEGITGLIQKLIRRIEKKQKKLGISENIVRLNQPVLEIKNEINSQVQVITNKDSYKCFKVLFSVSISRASKVKISRLSQAKRLIFQSQLSGSVEKMFIAFQSAFWRSRFSGKGVFSVDFPFSQMSDVSPPNLCCGILSIVICADKTQKWHQMFQKYEDQTEKYQAKSAYIKKFIASVFLKGDQKNALIQNMRLIATPSKQNFGYQTFTKLGVCLELAQKDEDYLQCYARDEHNIIFLGSELSKKFGSSMQGAVRHARYKIYNYLEIDDPWLNSSSS